ncbi:hypothetical protein J2T13_003970 [Paenibacillus sp. DS2015]|uniref:hypothetical protein n=1 Tax=Paenibacillus sp. DS2015 TaxID=3373917 RepID=UPI003D1A9518
MKKYSDKTKMNALLYAKASLAIEGMYLTTKEEQLVVRRVNGELGDTEFLSRAMEIAKGV